MSNLDTFMAASHIYADYNGALWAGPSNGSVAYQGVGFVPSYARYTADVLYASGDGHSLIGMDRSTYATRVLVNAPNAWIGYPQRCWDAVLYTQTNTTTGVVTIWACGPNGENNRYLNSGMAPCLSGDGTWFVFAGYDGTNGWQIWAQDYANTWWGRYTGPVTVWVPDNPANHEDHHGHYANDPTQLECFYPALSIDGASVAYVRGNFSTATGDPATWGKRNLWRTFGDGVNNGSPLTNYPQCTAGSYIGAASPCFGPDIDTVCWEEWSSSASAIQRAQDHYGNATTFWPGVVPHVLNPRRIAG